MRKLFVILIFSFARFCSLAQNEVIAITNVAIIDVSNGKVGKGMTVLIEGTRIISVKKKIAISKKARILDGTGKYLIPGLWDMHAHSFTDRKMEWLFPLLIANGITGVRDVGTAVSFDSIHLIKQQISERKLVGPRFGAVTQKIFNGIAIPNTPTMAITTPDEARRQVRKHKEQGMDFIKVYNQLSPEVFYAIIDEAKLQKIPVLGHVPFSMTASEVSDLGQFSIEHNTDILVSCSRDETKLRQELDALPKNLSIAAGPRQEIDIKAMQTFDEQKAIALFKLFKRNHTWLCPTIVVFPRSVKNEDQLAQDELLKYIPGQFRDQWYNQMKQRNIKTPNEDVKLLLQKRIDMVGLMHRTGVNILAGTDFMNPYLYPGFSIHDELELLVQAGLSPLEALQTATINPAKYFDKEREIGTVQEGKYADLVLLDENPLENILNSKKIYAVIANGRVLRRTELDKLLTEVQAIANK